MERCIICKESIWYNGRMLEDVKTGGKICIPCSQFILAQPKVQEVIMKEVEKNMNKKIITSRMIYR